MFRYSLAKLSAITQGVLKGDQSQIITHLSIDSRRMVFNDEIIFIALRGKTHDGHQYIAELVEKGMRHFMVDAQFSLSIYGQDLNFIVVDNTLDALQTLAKYRRSELTYPILGVTGSNGKTIVKEWIAQLAGNSLNISKSPKSYNSQVGVPLSMMLFESQSNLGVLEAGISMVGEMDRLEAIISPNYGLLTNIGQAHQENFDSINAKLKEKMKLFKHCSKVYFCVDDLFISTSIVDTCKNGQLVGWGKHLDANLRVEHCQFFDDHTTVVANWKNSSFQFDIPFADTASFENVMHAMLFLLDFGLSYQTILPRLADLKPVAMRLEQKEGRNGCLIIDDGYNSDFTSLELALDFLRQQARKKEMAKVVVLSDMFQSGLPQAELYQRISMLLTAHEVDSFIGIGNDIMNHAHLFHGRCSFYATTTDFIRSGRAVEFRNQVILLKGSRHFSFEKISDLLEQKQHQTVLEVNLNALSENLNYFRSLLKPRVQVLAMVKAFSYGSGSFEIAGLLQHQKVDYLGVAFADEGVELREAGISLPIMVMNPEKKSFPLMLQYQIEPEVYSFKLLDEFLNVVEQEGVSICNIHIKIETGMNRLGFLPSEMPKLIETLKRHPELKVKSVFSHLVGSENAVHDEFTNGQIAVFEHCSELLMDELGYAICRHILNSAGIERFPNAQFDMVRLGIGLYGVSAIQGAIRNVVTLKSYVSQIKPIDVDQSVGYGRRGKLPSSGRIAIVPIGYADGLDRRLGNGLGEFLIRGQVVKTVGNICMDMCMVDVTNIHCEEDDEVIIFGDDLPLWVMADKIDTISYEVLTGISRRVKRVYYQE